MQRVAPRPGIAVRGSTTGRPIMAALDLLGRRWALRIVWELVSAPAGFRELQARCGDMSASVLNTRLRELRQTAIVVLDADGRWTLSPLGRELVDALAGLHRWSDAWTAALAQAPRAADGGKTRRHRRSIKPPAA
jgi:DNA-binding HxlR family transcriptional regulator